MYSHGLERQRGPSRVWHQRSLSDRRRCTQPVPSALHCTLHHAVCAIRAAGAADPLPHHQHRLAHARTTRTPAAQRARLRKLCARGCCCNRTMSEQREHGLASWGRTQPKRSWTERQKRYVWKTTGAHAHTQPAARFHGGCSSNTVPHSQCGRMPCVRYMWLHGRVTPHSTAPLTPQITTPPTQESGHPSTRLGRSRGLAAWPAACSNTCNTPVRSHEKRHAFTAW